MERERDTIPDVSDQDIETLLERSFVTNADITTKLCFEALKGSGPARLECARVLSAKGRP